MTNNKKHLAILGATGSIGDSTLDIVRLHPDKFVVVALSAFRQKDKLLSLIQEFAPRYVAIGDDDGNFDQQVAAISANTQVLTGQDGLDKLASLDCVDTVVAAIVGAAGLSSTLAAVRAAKTVLLANKESLVMAGDLVMTTAKKTGATILPIDSEHNAIFQCLPTAIQRDVGLINQATLGIKKLWLTASGGAFLHKSLTDMQNASIDEATAHPNWSMGQKISIDSATMMNKGLEIIEACHLFAIDVDKIAVVIHPQSIVHSLVEYVDGSMIAHMGTPDMKTPIAHALAYPNRMDSGTKALDLYELSDLQFLRPDGQKFACLALAIDAIKIGNGACIVLNAANEVAVAAFLDGAILLTDIATIIKVSLDDDSVQADLPQTFDELAAIMALDKKARALASKCIDGLIASKKAPTKLSQNTSQIT